MVELVDGNNNHYAAWVEPVKADPWIICVAYDPITAAESSSGHYSGGDPIFSRGKVTRDQYEELEAMIVEKIQSKTDAAETRRMGTSILSAPDQPDTYIGMCKSPEAGDGPIKAAFSKLLSL